MKRENIFFFFLQTFSAVLYFSFNAKMPTSSDKSAATTASLRLSSAAAIVNKLTFASFSWSTSVVFKKQLATVAIKPLL